MNENDAKLSVRFFLHPQQNHKKTKEQGRPIFDQVEMVSIQAPGNRKTEHVANAHSMHYDSNVGKQHTYAERFAEAYRAFKDEVEDHVAGTPITEASFLDTAQKAEMRAAKIYTIEQLAGMADRNVRNMGMGFRTYVDQAKAYLDTALGTTALASEMDELRRQIAELKAGKEPVVEPSGADFSSYTDDDFRNMLTEAGITVDGRWGRERLIHEFEKATAEAA